MTEAALKLIEAQREEARPPEYNRPDWFDDLESRTGMRRHEKMAATFKYREVMKMFVEGTARGNMRVNANNGNHIFFVKNKGTELWLFKNNPSLKIKRCVAKKVNGAFVGNSSSLFFMKQKGGKIVNLNNGQMAFQRVMEEVMPLLPFDMFKETKLDINSIEMIDRGPGEKLDLGQNRKGVPILTHFMGAMVFKIRARSRSAELHYNGKTDQYFLFDIDRNDVKLKNLNFFISRLARAVTSIDDAYASLKPQEVMDAERFLGKPCERQGEWFFIPVQGDFKPKTERTVNGGQAQMEARLQSKGNRPHYVRKISEEGYVTGKVWHGGREHKDIELETWCKPVPNTAVESFKISGAID